MHRRLDNLSKDHSIVKVFFQDQAMTLIEVLVAVFVLSIGIVGSMLFLARAMTATETAKELTIATSHAESVMEEMRARESLQDVQETSWSTWAQQQGFNILPNETYDVGFENPGGNPLRAHVAVHWARPARPAGQVDLYTEISK